MSTTDGDPSTRPSSRTRLLVVDDQADVLELLGLLLESKGFDVATAQDGEEALAKASSAAADGLPFQAFVLDVSMPRMDGIDLARTLRDNPSTEAAPIFFSTGLTEADVRARFVDYAGFVPKPGDPVRLVQMLREALAARKAVPIT